jgi:bacteriorhodopsin
LYVISYALAIKGVRSRLLANKTVYSFAAWYTAFIWLLYPVCWGLSEGSNTITVTSEMVFYGILDLFAGPVFLFGFLFGVEDLEYDTLGLQSGKASDYVGAPVPAAVRPTEKAAEAQAGAAA